MSKLQFVNKNSCLCIYNYRTLLFCEARRTVNKLYLTKPSPNLSVNHSFDVLAQIVLDTPTIFIKHDLLKRFQVN